MRLVNVTLLPFAMLPSIFVAARTQDQSSALRAADPPANAVWVDSLDSSKAAVRRPRAPRGQTPVPLVFSLGGVTYPHAVPLVVNADITIDLGGVASRFMSMVGVDDDRKPGQGSVTFEVWVDGKQVASSGVMKGGDSPKLLTVDLTGARQLILASGDAGDGTRDDIADWGGAVIYRAHSAGAQPRIVDPPVDSPSPLARSRTSATTINQPRIIGGTPGRPFLFRIPASGDGPLTFAATNLPAGVALDSQTGIISGSLEAAGRTVVQLSVSGPKGRATAELTIVAGAAALALTPPLGWNSWNVWGGAVDDAKVRAAADAMVSSGLAAQGYQFINIDDSWEGPRDANGAITSNGKFPDMGALAAYVHSKGLKIGLYSSPGPRTCEGKYAGSYQHEEQDARSYANWGFDYLKYDWCSYSEIAPTPTLEDRKTPYRVMRSALDNVARDIVFSLCQYGAGNVWEWGADIGGNLWRTTGDITDTWTSMSGIGFAQGGHDPFAGPGHWNDPDMLVVGKVGWGPNVHDTRLTPNEQMTHITLWSLQAAPLLIGADMSQIDAFTIDLLGNREVLAVDQDPLGKAARRVWHDNDLEVWARPLSDGAVAVGLFNRKPAAQKVTARWSDLGLSGPRTVRDLWQQKDLGVSTGAFEATVPRHGAVLVRIAAPAGLAAVQAAAARERIAFDEGWRFAFGHTSDADKDFGYTHGQGFAKAGRGGGALSARFDDGAWRTVDLPHDWAVELPFQQSEDSNLDSHGYKPIGRAFPETTIGWYRKTFDIPAADHDRRIALEFDGIFRDSEVWFNGHQVCRNQGGYIGFRCDITDYVAFGAANLVVVRVDASQVEGWFYEGAGIYRHVWLTKTGPVHVAPHGVFVTTEMQGANALVTVRTAIENESDTAVEVELINNVPDATGARASTRVTVGPWASKEATLQMTIDRPALWSLEKPSLYALDTTITARGAALDDVKTTFGVRTIGFDKDRGFFLNGAHVELKGVCDHQDHAGVGSALPDRLNEWRLEQLKTYGVNALRTSHNPPTPELLDAADRLGILVMDEHRIIGSSPEILGQLRRLVERDRNHPSVIMWSIGNEEGIQTTVQAARIAKTMVRVVKAADPSRPTTYAANQGNADTGVVTQVDLRGFNYKNVSDIDAYRNDHPNQWLFASEEASTLSTRGEYADDAAHAWVSAYDVNRPRWGATAEDWWSFYDARPWLAGGFVWTGFDYRGEPNPYKWPGISSQFGILDTCGFPKDVAFYYQAWWTDRPVLHLLPHWNWAGKEGQPIDVWAFSNAEEVELLVNGKSVGRQTMKKDSHVEWKVPYQPGALEARAYRSGRISQTTRVETTGEPAKLVLSADRPAIAAGGRDVAIVSISAVDAQGRVVPTAGARVDFDVEGGRLLGVGNGDPGSHEPDTFPAGAAWSRSLFNGYAQAILLAPAAPGRVVLRARSSGLAPAELAIAAR